MEYRPESTRATCLENEPQLSTQFKFPDSLPGQLYDADMQCKFQFGFRSRLCKFYQTEDDLCRSLWCQGGGRTCETKFLPAAEGTPCADGKWCRKGVCVPQGAKGPTPIDGGWGPYSKWSSCTKSCGGGVKYKVRRCDNPRPSHGGKYCPGQNKLHKICKTGPCGSPTPDSQCSIFNNRTLRGKMYSWGPYHGELGALSRCRVYCVPDNATFFVLSTKLEDGTSCRRNFSSVCIDGKCQPVGCDGEVGSGSVPDLCGVCDGDNSTCRSVTGRFSQTNATSGYHQVVRITRGARNIRVVEDEPGSSRLALRSPSGHYYLSGRRPSEGSGRYQAGGTEVVYRLRHSKQEGFFARGPTLDDLVVEVLVQEVASPSVSFQFVVPLSGNSSHTRPTDEGPSRVVTPRCAGDCGSGVVKTQPRCSSDGARPCPPSSRPSGALQSIRWRTGPWTPCKGHRCTRGWRYRDVQCVNRHDDEVPDQLCRRLLRPSSRQNCHLQHCTRKWKVGPWTKCSSTCGGGQQTRTVQCAATKSEADTAPPADVHVANFSLPLSCDSQNKPSHSRQCNKEPCPQKEDRPRCEDSYDWCGLVRKHQLCRRQFYGIQCCKSCRDED